MYCEKTTKLCEISTLLLSTLHTDKDKVEISQNVLAFSEHMNFNIVSEINNLLETYCCKQRQKSTGKETGLGNRGPEGSE